MTRISVLCLALVSATLTLAQAGSNPPTQQPAAAATADRDAPQPGAQSGPVTPREADIAFAQATKERGLDGWMSFFADDAYVGTNPDVKGKLELRRFYQRLFSRRDMRFEWAPDHSEVFPSGIMGYTSGRYTMSYTSFEGKTASQTGSYLTVWQKQPDGSWKVLTDFGSQDKPEAARKPKKQP